MLARDTESPTLSEIDPCDSQKLSAGQSVTIAPDDSLRGKVSGKLHILNANEIAIKHKNDSVGEVIVHFPRIGYRLTS
ncbi:MAG: hypothetical protein GKR93_18305 [Gammaproteobacteria bacterium]|nr:hypothetical protein [Gammaproteobacteria bacterium]